MKDMDTMVKKIIEDIDDASINDISTYAPLTYEVWSIGYDAEDKITDSEMFIKEFKDSDEAIAYAKQLTLADIIHMDTTGVETESVVAYIAVEVETVITDPDGEFIDGSMNIGTIYRNKLWIKEEDVSLTSNDYTILEDGTLRVNCELLADYNEKDQIKILFVEEDSILTYKIVAKDKNYYYCEFIY